MSPLDIGPIFGRITVEKPKPKTGKFRKILRDIFSTETKKDEEIEPRENPKDTWVPKENGEM